METELTKNNAVVAIAQDVLERLSLHELHVAENYYLRRIYDVLVGTNPSIDARELLTRIEDKCTVCALGACLLSYIRLYDDVKVNDLRNGMDESNIYRHLGKYFTPHQLKLIEVAFELSDRAGPVSVILNNDDYNAANTFGRGYEGPVGRLRAIMENIIANDGVFKPG